MKKYDKTTIAGVAACAVLLVLWGPLMRNLGLTRTGQPAPAPSVTQENAPTDVTPPPGAPKGVVAPPVEGVSSIPTPPSAAPADVTPGSAPTSVAVPPQGTVSLPFRPPALPLPAAVHSLTVDGLVDVAVDPAGTGISTVSLGNYLSDDRTQAVQLGRYQQPLCAVVLGQTPWGRAETTEVMESTDTVLVVRSGLQGGLTLTQTWEVLPDSPYQLSYRISIRNGGALAAAIPSLPVSCGALPANPVGAAGGSKRMAAMNAGIDVAFVGEERPKGYSVKKLGKLKGEAARALSERPTEWVAVHTKYFLFYVASASDPFPGVAVGTISAGDDPKSANPWLYAGVLLDGGTLEPGQDRTWELSCYAGPKQYGLLKQIDNRLLSVMRMDLFFGLHPRWMAWISGRILTALLALSAFFDHRWGYGFAIIVITFVIKMLFWPLTHRSTASMRKMQAIQPLVKELREKHGDQPEKMNRKVMELYKEHNVSPLGGCMPMFLQIPVFFALFNTFRSAIELRQAEFLWVADLSVPDTIADPFGVPIRPLAILMAVSMLGQQKMMPSSADPSQARMMMFMSVFFMFIFYSMPAGLTLYWTVNQILTIVQTLVSRRLEKKPES